MKDTADRACTCHPSEAPNPCEGKFAYSECVQSERARMTDIVDRLKEGTRGSDVTKSDSFLDGVMMKAAEEITRLREENARLREAPIIEIEDQPDGHVFVTSSMLPGFNLMLSPEQAVSQSALLEAVEPALTRYLAVYIRTAVMRQPANA